VRPPRYRREVEQVVSGSWPDSCVLFSGKQQPNGYGRVSVHGHYVRSHVFACEVAHGPCPDGKEAGHSCGNRMCINPRHLRWVTRSENEADKVVHGRSNRGERSGAAKVTQEDVTEIRRAYKAGGCTQQSLAESLGVSLMTVNDIIRRRTWKHL